MTEESFLAWLKDPAAIGVVLIEATALIGGVETTVRLATKGFNTGPGDTPPNTHYRPIARVGTLFTERMSLDGDGMLSAGDIEIDNTSGERDAWLGYVWTNRPIKAFVGDVRWARGDFRLIFDGIVADIAPRGRGALALRLRDKLQRLNAPVSEQQLGGSTPNAGELVPVTLGECHNVTPLLVDPATLTYQVHGGQIERLIEVRDNGVPVAATANLAAGTFTLGYQSAGAVTASVQGDKAGTYANTVVPLVQRLVTGYGKASDRFTANDLDAANLAAFGAAHPQPLGNHAAERLNVLEACRQLAGSVGAQLSMSRLGKLRLLKIALPPAGVPFVVRPEHMVDRTLQPVSRPDVVGAVKLGYCRNWTVQEGLVTNIPEQHRDLCATEWLSVTKSDAAVQSAYRLSGEPVQQDTMLLRKVDAEAEAQRRLNLWKTPRTVYEFEGMPELLQLELGQAITVYSPRFGMESGVSGQVVALAPDWLTRRVKVEFIV